MPENNRFEDPLEFEGTLDQFRGHVQGCWPQLTDEDFDAAEGDLEKLIGTISMRTGDNEDSVRHRFDEWMTEDTEYAA